MPLSVCILHLRQLSGLSQRQLARQVGVSHTQLQRLEAGKLLPSAPQVQRLASALGVRADVLARASLGAPGAPLS